MYMHCELLMMYNKNLKTLIKKHLKNLRTSESQRENCFFSKHFFEKNREGLARSPPSSLRLIHNGKMQKNHSEEDNDFFRTLPSWFLQILTITYSPSYAEVLQVSFHIRFVQIFFTI